MLKVETNQVVDFLQSFLTISYQSNTIKVVFWIMIVITVNLVSIGHISYENINC